MEIEILRWCGDGVLVVRDSVSPAPRFRERKVVPRRETIREREKNLSPGPYAPQPTRIHSGINEPGLCRELYLRNV